MSKMQRQYIKQYFKNNARLLILVVIVQILILQNLFSPINFIMEFILGIEFEATGLNLDTLFLCICFMSFLLPLYQYRYLMKRSSSDLYLSLPIKREDFFQTQFLIGVSVLVGTTFLSLFVSNLLYFSLFTLFEKGIHIILLEILGISLYALFTWIIMKCNTFLDSFMVCAGYTIFPFFFILSAYTFFSRITNVILISDSYGIGDVFNSDIFFLITSFLSTPFAMLSLVDHLRMPYADNLHVMILLIVYWIILGILLYFLAKKAYVMRKGEQSGERTKSWIAYPIMIPLLITSLLFMNGVKAEKLFSVIFIFIMYITMYFFAQRKLKITLFIVMQYVCLVGFTFVIEQYLVANKMFNQVQEVYPLDYITQEQVSISLYDGAQENKNLKTYFSEEWNFLNDEDRAALQAFHKELLTYCEEKNQLFTEGEFAIIQFDFKVDNNKLISYRMYGIDNDAGLSFIEASISKLVSDEILIEYQEEQ